MDDINYEAVIAQLQAENEALRLNAKLYHDIHTALRSPIEDIQAVWRKATENKTQLLIGLMLLYWIVSIVFLIWEHFE